MKEIVRCPRPKGREPKTPEPKLDPKYSVIIITVTTLFEDSLFYKPAETYTIRTPKEYAVNGEIERFFQKLGKREKKESSS